MSRFGISLKKGSALIDRMARLCIKEADIAESFMRSSGPGGQNVNKVSTGVYLKHIPTGIEVKCVAGRSQGLNRFIARRILIDKIEARIFGRLKDQISRIEKIRRQKRKRSKRAKEKMLRQKKIISEKKMMRKKVEAE